MLQRQLSWTRPLKCTHLLILMTRALCALKDGMVKLEITHTDIRSKRVRIFNEHGAAAPQYDALQHEKDYKDDMVKSDWKVIMPEIHSFNSHMRKALMDAKVPHIYESIDRGYHNTPHPLGGVLAWKKVMELQSGDINNDKTTNMAR